MLKYAVAAALAAVLASKYTSQPPPYDDGAASIIKVDARLLAGNAHGAPFPPVYKGKWALNDRLTKATWPCLLYTSPSPRDGLLSRMPSSA